MLFLVMVKPFKKRTREFYVRTALTWNISRVLVASFGSTMALCLCTRLLGAIRLRAFVGSCGILAPGFGSLAQCCLFRSRDFLKLHGKGDEGRLKHWRHTDLDCFDDFPMLTLWGIL